MAPVEANIYCTKVEDNVDFLKVEAGKSQSIDCLDGVTLAIHCNVRDSKGMIQVGGKHDLFEAILTQEISDGTVGQVLNTDELENGVTFSGDQEVSIHSLQGHSEVIYLKHIDPHLPKSDKPKTQTNVKTKVHATEKPPAR